MSRQVGVITLPSLKAKPQCARCQLSTVKPIFEVLGSRENCDSVDEGAADRDAIAAAGELARLVPDFEGMHVAGVEQFGIGAHDRAA